MNYIGSKLSLLRFMDQSISQVIGADGHCATFCDLLAGTGAVGSYFKKKGYLVIANDIQYYSYVLNRHYIGNRRQLSFRRLTAEIDGLKHAAVEDRRARVCDYLSHLPGIKGFVYENYCYDGTRYQDVPRRYFSDRNGMKCDAIRTKIESWWQQQKISEDEYYFLLASLIESIDRCANTASVYGAFLKQLKNSARKDLVLAPAELIVDDKPHRVHNGDINEVITEVSGDILYLDPPYNQRQYAANYHVLETIARYDRPRIYGKTGLRRYQSQKSRYCSPREVKKTFRDLIAKARAKYIFLSYNNEGLMSPGDIEEIMSSRGKYGCFSKQHTRFKADTSKKRKHAASATTAHLHYVVVSDAVPQTGSSASPS